jgi:hypothetical protein
MSLRVVTLNNQYADDFIIGVPNRPLYFSRRILFPVSRREKTQPVFSCSTLQHLIYHTQGPKKKIENVWECHECTMNVHSVRKCEGRGWGTDFWGEFFEVVAETSASSTDACRHSWNWQYWHQRLHRVLEPEHKQGSAKAGKWRLPGYLIVNE